MGIILATLITLFFINFISGAWILFKDYHLHCYNHTVLSFRQCITKPHVIKIPNAGC